MLREEGSMRSTRLMSNEEKKKLLDLEDIKSHSNKLAKVYIGRCASCNCSRQSKKFRNQKKGLAIPHDMPSRLLPFFSVENTRICSDCRSKWLTREKKDEGTPVVCLRAFFVVMVE